MRYFALELFSDFPVMMRYSRVIVPKIQKITLENTGGSSISVKSVIRYVRIDE